MAFRAPAGKACPKVKYANEGDAIHEIARSRRWAAGMSAYYHGPCKAWHIGHTPGTRGRKRR